MPGRRQSLLTEGGGDCGLLLEPPNVGPVLELHLTPVDDVGVVKDRLNLGVPSSKAWRHLAELFPVVVGYVGTVAMENSNVDNAQSGSVGRVGEGTLDLETVQSHLLPVLLHQMDIEVAIGKRQNKCDQRINPKSYQGPITSRGSMKSFLKTFKAFLTDWPDVRKVSWTVWALETEFQSLFLLVFNFF